MSVCIGDELVVDLYGGDKDTDPKLGEWEADTLVNVYSVTKGWTALCVHMLKERGHIDSYDDPIAKYWPEFAANGKEGVTIRMALAHKTGLQTLRHPVYDIEQATNWGYMTGLLAAQAPWWEPGSKSAYHAFTFGHINGEIVRRCDPKHRSIGKLFDTD